MKRDENDLLKYALEHGIIDLADIRSGVDMTRREEILGKHTNKVWQGKDGKWRTYIHAEGYPKNLKLVCKTTRKALEDTIVDAYEETENVHTFEEVFTEWNNHRLDSKIIAPKTHVAYVEIFKRFFKDNKLRTKDLSKTTVFEWQEFLEKSCSGVCKPQFGNLRALIKGTLIRAKKMGYISYSVSEIFETLDISSSQFKVIKHDDSDEVYTDEEFKKIQKYICENPHKNYLGILLIFVSGLRIGELCALKRDSISDDYVIHVRGTASYQLVDDKKVVYIKDTPKTENGLRDIPIPKNYWWIVDKLFEYKSDDGYIFCKFAASIRRSLEIICRNCNITYKPLHKIRKTYSTTLLDSGVNPKIVAKLMGHSNSYITTTVYNKDKSSISEKSECVNNVFNKD